MKGKKLKHIEIGTVVSDDKKTLGIISVENFTKCIFDGGSS